MYKVKVMVLTLIAKIKKNVTKRAGEKQKFL